MSCRPASLALCLLLLIHASACSRASQEKPSPASSAPSAQPSCTPLAQPGASWQKVSGAFFSLQLPPSWQPQQVPQGAEYRDAALKRKLALTLVEVAPAPGADVGQALDALIEGVRTQVAGLGHGMSPGPTREQGSADQPIRFFVVTSEDKSFVAGLVGRRVSSGLVRGVSVTYVDESPGATPACIEQSAIELLRSLRVNDAAPTSPVRFTPATVAALRGELQPGEVVWVAVKKTPEGLEPAMEVRSDLPSTTPVVQIEGIPVVIDPQSEPHLRGFVIDHVAGQGFRFDKPQ